MKYIEVRSCKDSVVTYENVNHFFHFCIQTLKFDECFPFSNLPGQVRHLIDTLKTYQVRTCGHYSYGELSDMCIWKSNVL